MIKKIFAVVLVTAFFALSNANFVQAQSLWADSNWSLFADKKARNVGDILTIVINESTTQTASKARSNEKEGSVDIGLGTGWLKFLNKATSASGSDSFEATGSARDTNRFIGQISATVVEVLPNGNMVIEGTQSIWQQRDEHKITISGVVRRDDVTMNNTIPSTKIANATIRFDGKGPLNAKQRQGILTQIFNILF